MSMEGFHAIVGAWFETAIGTPTPAQLRAWAAVQAGRDVLVAAPTGSGKTLAAFLAAIDELVREGEVFGLPDETRILYISPLKALSNDIHKNLQLPLEGIQRMLFEAGRTALAIRSQVRTGDTPATERAAMKRQPPHILVTTPESIYILLTSASGRRMLGSVRTVIVDEIHAVLGSKRGSHLALSLERLERLAGRGLRRIGLSATQRPVEEVARFLTGGRGECIIVDEGHRRRLDLGIELPDFPLEAVLSNEAAGQVYDRMAELVRQHRTTLVFVNTRRMAERLARALAERVGEDSVTSHHGSLSKEQRLEAENRLKAGALKALVATASLELGIDIGDIDLVCQFGATGTIAAFLQRVGRSGHYAGGLPKGRLFPTSRDDLVDCIALVDALRQGELDRIPIPAQPLDVLAQQIVAMVACEEWGEDELYAVVRGAYPYRELAREAFDALLAMLADGYSTRRGIRGAYLHRDRIHGRLRPRKGALLTAVTCGGAIPDNAEYRVIVEPSGEVVGSVDEDFAIESMSGDVFQLGNTSWRVLRLEGGALRVEDAAGIPPSIPFWFGEAPGRSHELSLAVSRLRARIGDGLEQSAPEKVAEGLSAELGLAPGPVQQAVDYLAAAKAVLGVLPTFDTVVFERFFDESGGMQFIIHAPFGSRVNRAWGLALRKRFCRTFNFELQAAATENALILSLGVAQSFALEEVKQFLSVDTVRTLLVQAMLDAPMFKVRWRWNAVCALALKRFQGGGKTPPYLLRMQAEDLVTCVFPDQLACFENIVGDREVPDHPLVNQTVHDCLTEAMDLDRLIEVIRGIREGTIRVECRDLTEPSPLAAEIVNSKVYTFLDGAPLEERRTRAVSMRRWLEPGAAGELGQLDAAAIARVLEEIEPQGGAAEEVHDALSVSGYVTVQEAAQRGWMRFLAELAGSGRAARLPCGGAGLWLAAERWPQFRAVYPDTATEPALRLPPALDAAFWEPGPALVEILRARLGVIGPATAARLVAQTGLAAATVEAALYALENEGTVLRGTFTPGASETEWCERGILARIHRYTLGRLRQAIEPVTAADFVRFLLHWQHVHPAAKVRGKEGLALVLDRLEGFQATAAAWERELLPLRVEDYDPAWLDALCVSGRILWRRLPREGSGGGSLRVAPLVLLPRVHSARWLPAASPEVSGIAARVAESLERRGAQFFDELVASTGLLKTQTEDALSELAAKGRVTSDSFMGLRALLMPEQRKRRYRGVTGIEDAGRWSLAPSGSGESQADRTEHAARVLLKRYGVVFRSLLEREPSMPAWLELVRVYRRLEARGEIRGGRFIAGRYGEQFALPEAVESLRKLRSQPPDGLVVSVDGADPLNLAGIVLPGERIAANSGKRLVLRDGVPVAVGTAQGVVHLATDGGPVDPRQAAARPPVAPGLRAYLGKRR
ncbi:DEAD/DEAH box helicase [Methylococcus geothermalis]|uniref:DEAD/DEAH box helicase n=1 Tax=Methylococcus geothermalis TaxID=2681310 RepID=A0A858Q897_9GAMM|nr:DEAD/DEAH box helicase [Methylococcus geothermalis]QJD30050.1 DEAD/DEAH box helicase [Methylococcus geothermalis]